VSSPVLGVTTVDLARWDGEGRGDLLAVYLWDDVRPLRGAAGLLDWRLCGKLSGLAQSGRLTGAEGEQLLLPTAGRLPWKVAMVMGLGSRVGFSGARFRTAVLRLFAAARGLGVRELAMAPPGRDVEALPARRALDLVLAELRAKEARNAFDRVTIIDTAAVHKELVDWLRTAPAAP
jgi:hypothetical protein